MRAPNGVSDGGAVSSVHRASMMRPIIFTCATLVLVWVSRSQLRRPDSHGFYRFVAWELMLAHWILVRPYGLRRWFIDPLSPLHLIAWCLLAGAAVLTAWPVYLLWVRGKANGGREDALLFPFEKTTELVVGGPYAFMRHPMYAGLLLATWGVLMLKFSWGVRRSWWQRPAPSCWVSRPRRRRTSAISVPPTSRTCGSRRGSSPGSYEAPGRVGGRG